MTKSRKYEFEDMKYDKNLLGLGPWQVIGLFCNELKLTGGPLKPTFCFRKSQVDKNVLIFDYSLFHKTLPKSSLQMRWFSVRFYAMSDISHYHTFFRGQSDTI